MLCPRCGSNQSDEVKFCTSCGGNLHALREALESREAGKKFDWSDTWVAEMFMSHDAQRRLRMEKDRQMGITPEMKRYNEIKAGVIVSSIGVGLAIFLFVFMQGLVGSVDPRTAEILSRLWIAGVIPFFVGIALMFNGLVVSKRLVELHEREMKKQDALEGEMDQRALRPAEAGEFVPARFSVTEGTTRHLAGSEQQQKH
ncbi:MAG TPA: hypothetical protein VFP64_13480 [Pyrinomonadaceae bacterium]|nr:hypothetical protein [Pyrinomonadaceae bacterium]